MFPIFFLFPQKLKLRLQFIFILTPPPYKQLPSPTPDSFFVSLFILTFRSNTCQFSIFITSNLVIKITYLHSIPPCERTGYCFQPKNVWPRSICQRPLNINPLGKVSYRCHVFLRLFFFLLVYDTFWILRTPSRGKKNLSMHTQVI